jgi:glycosyltransferase involved in cell wall biosynthesis
VHIIETYFDVCGFDHRLVQGGTSVYLWNLSRSFAALGHRVSVVTPAHGWLDGIRQFHDVTELSYVDEYPLVFPLDTRVWRGFPEQASIPLRTTAHHVRIEGVDLYFLSNELLDQLPDTFYPPYGAKGNDLVFFKPLAFQVDSVRFIREWFAGDRAVVHTHEPYYHYLIPAALRDDPDKLVVSTVQSNMPITKMVYRPEVDALLNFLGADAALPTLDSPPWTPLDDAMSQYQQRTHLHYEYPPDHVAVFALVAENADLVDFLSPGHLDFYSTFADTPFERLFGRLSISDTVARNAHKSFVGGCALSDWWLATPPATVDREKVRAELGLDPSLPTFYHNARYAVHHKGQVELMRAIDEVLSDGLPANFIVRALSGTGIDDPYFHDVVRRHRGRVYLEWERVPEERVFAYAASSDFCLFPSKFEMDTFLIAQGEAMACGSVPVATAQYGMAHFNHVADPLHGPRRDQATGFAVNRSFVEDDDLLVAALVDRIRAAVRLLREQPDEYHRLSANAVATAREFTWERCARQHLAAFEPLHSGVTPVLSDDAALRHGWFDRLSPGAWRDRPADIAARALELGDVDAYARCAPLSGEAVAGLLRAAYERADFGACERIAARAPGHGGDILAAVHDRHELTVEVDAGPTTHVRYRLPHAVRVEAVVPAPPGTQRGSATVTPLRRGDDGDFTVRLPGSTPPGGLCLLITLDSGRVAWDVVGHA